EIQKGLSEGVDMVICTGGMSVDPDDVTPTAIKECGGELVTYGSPVLPGAMFLLAYHGNTPILGVPSCAMYSKRTVLDLVLPTAQQLSSSSAPATTGFTLQSFLSHVFPRSIAEAMANNDILQVLVFSIFFGSALAFVNQGKEKDSVIIRLTDELSKIMFRITDYVMMFAPVAVFAAIASAITVQGLGLIVDYGILIAEFYFGLLLLWIILFSVGAIVLKKDIFRLGKLIREPVTLAFATASSESAYPKVMDALNKFGVPKKVTSFVLPLGYSFNLDGSMMYTTFAVLFIAQAYNIDLSFTQQILILLTLMVTSKGIAGVSRASIVVISATLTMFHLPEAGILLLLGIDQFLDMGRTATNVVGNSIATAVVAKLEGDKVADTEELPEPVLIKSTQEQTTA
ncbi:MAG: cation:dicarboxylase symporter family transporter, partial [Acinetobacter sp.]|uniref:cation:dicarboxylate symporter family transporter n=1 Tax=Acinetobacter sp. TaxID=472 RepID=UPI002907F580